MQRSGLYLPRTLLVLSISLSTIFLDQFSKKWAVDLLRFKPSIIYFNDLFRLEYAENPGAFLGMGGNLPQTVRFVIFTVAVALIMIGMFFYILKASAPTLETIAFSLIVGGGVGNLIDRAFRPGGHVVDFLNLGIGSLRTGIFNVADMAIVGGVALIFVLSLRPKKIPMNTLP